MAIGVGLDTKVRRQGLKTVGDLKPEDRVLVQARVCKEDLKDDLTPALTASKVIATRRRPRARNRHERRLAPLPSEGSLRQSGAAASSRRAALSLHPFIVHACPATLSG